MTVTLSWDLFVIVFFALVITYSFIIGMHETIKIAVATYIAVLAVQGIGNILGDVTGDTEPILRVLGLSIDITLLGTAKLLIFVVAMVFLAVRGGIEIEYGKEPGGMISGAVTAAMSFATAGLMLVTLLTYIADLPLLDPTLGQTAAIGPLMQQSNLLGAMVHYQNVWFCLPALLLIAIGIISSE